MQRALINKMPKDIFTDEQEDQIRKAFDWLDTELGLYNLDDNKDLERIFSKVQPANPSRIWLSEQLREVEAKLTKLTYAVDSLFERKKAFENTGKYYESPLSQLMEEINKSKVDSWQGENLREISDQVVKLSHEILEKQEESVRITEAILRKFSDNFEEKLFRLTLVLEKHGEVILASTSTDREDQEDKSKDSTNPEIALSTRQGNKSHGPKHARGAFSLLGDILASPTYAIASLVLIITFGLAVGFQSSELNALKQVEDPLRGGKETFQIVENPVKAAQLFQNELISENIPYQIDFESMNKIKINIPVNEKTLLIASSRRIELPQEKQTTLVFEKSK
jgi:hypothetical protein